MRIGGRRIIMAIIEAHSFTGWVFKVRNHALDLCNAADSSRYVAGQGNHGRDSHISLASEQTRFHELDYAESPTQFQYLDRDVLLEKRHENRIPMIEVISEKGIGRYCKILNTPRWAKMFQLKDLRETRYSAEQDIVMKRMFSLIDDSESRLVAEHLAFLDDAVVIITPDNAQGTLNFGFLLHEISHLHVLMLFGKDNKLNITIDIRSENSSATYVQELFAGEGSEIQEIVRESAVKGNLFALKRSSLAKGASLKIMAASKAEQTLISKMHTQAEGANARIKTYSAFNTKGQGAIEQESTVSHLAPGSDAETVTKGIVGDESSCLVKGMIDIAQEASQTTSNYNGKVLVTGGKAKANILPILRIKNNDVQAKHGASVGQFSDEDMFYLMSRGLTQEEARRMMTEGFFGQMMTQFPKQDQEGILGFFRA